MKEEFVLSKKEKIRFLNDIGLNLHYFKPSDVKEFIRLCEDNSEEINGTSYIKISKMQKLAGDKLK